MAGLRAIVWIFSETSLSQIENNNTNISSELLQLEILKFILAKLQHPKPYLIQYQITLESQIALLLIKSQEIQMCKPYMALAGGQFKSNLCKSDLQLQSQYYVQLQNRKLSKLSKQNTNRNYMLDYCFLYLRNSDFKQKEIWR